MSLDPAISWTIALSGTLLFGVAAAQKLHGWREFREVVRNYQLVQGGLASVTAFAVVASEMVAALLLLSTATRSLGALLACSLLLLYALAMAINLDRGRVNLDCGCLGPGRRQPVRWWMVVRNAIFAVLMLLAAMPLSKRSVSALDVLTIVGATVTLALLYIAHNSLSTVLRPAARAS